jgi:NAD(P)-dependent dehydrogenase (short-subunit alcohol dehydrogenase family)
MENRMKHDFGDLDGKVAVLTGGTGIIGGALARALALAGVKVVIAGRERAKAEAIAARIGAETGGTLIGLGFDVLDRQALEAARVEIHARLGLVDFLINGAGGNKPAATTGVEFLTSAAEADKGLGFFGLDPEAFDGVFRLNFTGTLLPSQIFAQDMVGRGGVVLNISSMSAYRPLTKVAAYSASKSAINNFTQWLAVHLAPQSIRVNAIAPGFFLTEQNRFILTDEKTGEKTPRARKIIAGTPMGRFGEVEELAGATLFLLSDLSRFVTGIVLPVDGGFSAYSGV